MLRHMLFEVVNFCFCLPSSLTQLLRFYRMILYWNPSEFSLLLRNYLYMNGVQRKRILVFSTVLAFFSLCKLAHRTLTFLSKLDSVFLFSVILLAYHLLQSNSGSAEWHLTYIVSVIIMNHFCIVFRLRQLWVLSTWHLSLNMFLIAVMCHEDRDRCSSSSKWEDSITKTEQFKDEISRFVP